MVWVCVEVDVFIVMVGMIWIGELVEDLFNKGCVDVVMVGWVVLCDINWLLCVVYEFGVFNEEVLWYLV